MKTCRIDDIPFDDHNDPRTWNRKIGGKFKDIKGYHIGGNSVVVPPEMMDEKLPEIIKHYPNLDLCAKINIRYINQTYNLDKYTIKNIAWLNGFGPRVYQVFDVKCGEQLCYHAHLMEYIRGSHPSTNKAIKLWVKYEKKFEKHHIKFFGRDLFPSNFIGRRLIDYDEFYLGNKKAYARRVRRDYKKHTFWGNPASPYQDIPMLRIKGCRSYDRFRLLGMDKLDLEGKTILDIGCSGGQVLFWAAERGAARIVGLDTPAIARVTFELANLYHYFNIETIGCDLNEDNIVELVKKQTGLDKFDYVVMFSVNAHIGFHQYMKDLCGGTLFLETNAAKMPEVERVEYPEILKKMGYTKFEYKGQVNESGGRSLFRCQ